jgi:hypothetical protein
MVLSMAEALEWKHKGISQIAWGILTSALIYLSFYAHVVAWVAAAALLLLLWSFKSHPKVKTQLTKVAFRFQWPLVLKRTLASRKLGDSQLTLPEGALFSAAPGTRGTSVLVHIVPNTLQLEILSAHYGAGDRWLDVTELVKLQVENGRLSMFVSNADLGGDPSWGTPKTLNIEYLDHGQKRFASFNETTHAEFPRPFTPLPTSSTRDPL